MWDQMKTSLKKEEEIFHEVLKNELTICRSNTWWTFLKIWNQMKNYRVSVRLSHLPTQGWANKMQRATRYAGWILQTKELLSLEHTDNRQISLARNLQFLAELMNISVFNWRKDCRRKHLAFEELHSFLTPPHNTHLSLFSTFLLFL